MSSLRLALLFVLDFHLSWATPADISSHCAQYNASKAGLIHLAKSLAVEWIDFARVNCISPGYIATEMTEEVPKELSDEWVALTPAKRMGEAHELKGVKSTRMGWISKS